MSVGRWYSLGALLGVSVLLSACSTEGFLDSVGMGKNVPDESRVSTVQPLALPPDYRLPPPQEPREIADEDTAPAAAPTTGVETASMAQPTQIAANSDPNAPTSPAQKEPEISRVNPDGTPKSQRQIYDEARKKKMEQRRAQNPNYGTWKNLWGALWN